MSEKLRIAVIGVGRWGGNVLKTLAVEPDIEIAWTAGSKDWQKKIDKTTGAALRTDGVVIAVPANAQPSIARHALDHGLPIFIEKPMALDPADARLIRNRAAMMGDLPVVVDHVHLFAAEYEALRAELTGRGISYIESFAGNLGPVREWGTDYAALWDYGPHEAAFALDLIGVPDAVTGTRARSQYGDDHVVRLTFGNPQIGGAWATLSFGNSWTAKRRTLYVHSEGDLWKIDALAQFGERLSKNGQPIAVTDSHVPPLTRALRVWIAAVRGDRRDDRIGCDFGVKVTELLFRVQEAIRTGGEPSL